MSIAIVGAGAIGGYLGVRLAEAGEDVTFIARSNAEAIRANGMRLIDIAIIVIYIAAFGGIFFTLFNN